MKRRNFLQVSLTTLVTGWLIQQTKAYGLSKLWLENSNNINTVYPSFNLRKIPFSYIGSYHTINLPDSNTRLKINTVRRSAIPYKWQQGWANECFDIAVTDDGKNELPFTVDVTPWRLQINAGKAFAMICFYDKNTLTFYTNGCNLLLIPGRNFAWKYPTQDGGFVFYDNQTTQFNFINTDKTISAAALQLKLPEAANDSQQRDAFLFTGNGMVTLRMITDEAYKPLPSINIDTLMASQKGEVDKWMKLMPMVKKEHLNAAKTGWFLSWNLQVSPWGNYTRQSILSSKKSMDMLWSWDICFNALAVMKADYRLAWDQLFAILDKQKSDGVLPDAVNDLSSTYGYNKPPVWGFTVMKLLKHTPQNTWKQYLNEFYPKIVKFTDWWYQHRDSNHNHIAEYASGNDSGWDNATVFDARLPVESPDLTAFLILEADALSFIATYLGKEAEAKKWQELSNRQLALFHESFFIDGELMYRELENNGKNKPKKSTSLLTRIPIVLGKKLNPEIRAQIVKELSEENVFLTKNGLASEAVNSAKYESNGYWRGPVWGPSTYLIVDGLIQCGEIQLAQLIAQRFCDMVSRDMTFSENYDALTGKGQYDSGLTWLSSDFILLAEWLATVKM